MNKPYQNLFDPATHVLYRWVEATQDYVAGPIRILDDDWLAWPKVVFPPDFAKFKQIVLAEINKLRTLPFTFQFKQGAPGGQHDPFGSDESYLLLTSNETKQQTTIPCGMLALAINYNSPSLREIIVPALANIGVS